jgi:hypothetical protein
MTESHLDEAMGFGAPSGKTSAHLGKYGMGLKSASFSQCERVTVLTIQDGIAAARRWTAENVRSGWVCEHIDPIAADRMLKAGWGAARIAASGTVILWEHLDAFRVARNRVDGVLEEQIKSIAQHVGLHFHRFLERGLIQVQVDAKNDETGGLGPPRTVTPLNPFAYPANSVRGYPKVFRMTIPGLGPLRLDAHIWPRKSRLPGYVLGGGKVSQRQGLYFYRNDRLIQAGGWNGWRQDDEPHLSLARVSVDLPGAYDEAFALNVQKSAVEVPADFVEALGTLVSDGVSFQQFVRDAQEQYSRKAESSVGAALVPGTGVAPSVAKEVGKVIRKSASGAPKRVPLRWARLPPGRVFAIDRDRDAIVLNSGFRKEIEASPATQAQLIKVLIFLLARDDVERQRMSGPRLKWIEMCQAALVATIRTAK